FAAGEMIPARFSADGEDISPPLQWTRGPKGTESYVLIMEDPDAPDPSPFVHWLLYDIPADVTGLQKGIPAAAETLQPAGMRQGKNDCGSIGYFGPKPPHRDPAHEYHFQVFALDRKLEFSAGATRAEIMLAMRGHVLASGDLVGTYRR